MSDHAHDHADVGAHTGPIKNPTQLLVASVFSFVVPVFVIIGLVYFVVSAVKPSGSGHASSMALGGVSEQAREQGIATRLQKVGTVEIRDANRPLAAGEAVYKAQCAACHAAGVAGAPKFGEAGDWAARLGHGFEAMVQAALKGKGAMAPQGGGDFSDLEIARGVAYLANSGGGKFEEPAAPAAAAEGGDAAPAK